MLTDKKNDAKEIVKLSEYVSNNEKLEKIVKKYEKEIMKETLAEKVEYNAKRDDYTEVSINDEKLMLDVEVIK